MRCLRKQRSAHFHPFATTRAAPRLAPLHGSLPRAFPQTFTTFFSCEGGWRAHRLRASQPRSKAMSIPWNAIAEHTPAVPPSVRADRVIVRRFDPAFDSYAQLTPMLHRAFARLGAMGLNCVRRPERGRHAPPRGSGRVLRRRVRRARDRHGHAVCDRSVVGVLAVPARRRRERAAGGGGPRLPEPRDRRVVAGVRRTVGRAALYAARTRYAAPRFAPACVLRCWVSTSST